MSRRLAHADPSPDADPRWRATKPYLDETGMVEAPYPTGGDRLPGYPTSRIDPTKRPVSPRPSDLSRVTSRIDPNLPLRSLSQPRPTGGDSSVAAAIQSLLHRQGVAR